MASRIERLTGVGGQAQLPALVVGLGHGGTHWIIGTFYLLLPFIKTDLGLSYAAAGLLVTLIHASAFIANFGSGALVDLTGRRILIQVFSLVVGAAALMACGWAQGLPALLVLVCLIGATNNLWHPAAIAFLSERYPDNRGYVLSVHAFGASAGDAVAPAVVGAMIVWAGWQHTALYGALPVFAVAALIFVALTSQDAGTRGGVARGLGLREYLRGIATLLRDRGVLGLSIMAGFRSMAQNGLLVFIPLYLVDVLGVGPLLLGVAVMVMQIGGMVAGPVAGTWSDRVGRRRIVLAGLTGTTVVVVLLTLAASEVVFIGGVAVLGFMLFAVRPVIHSWMMDITPPELSGSAVSALFGTQSAFSVAIPLVGGVIADAFGLPVVFYALAASMLVANTLVYLLPEAPCDSSR